MSDQKQEATLDVKPTQQMLINALRDGITKTIEDNNLGYSVAFNALSQVVASYAFEFVGSANGGALVEERVNAVIYRFAQQTKEFAAVCLEGLRQEQAQQEAATPKIITEL